MLATFEMTMTAWRGSRSAITPPRRMNAGVRDRAGGEDETELGPRAVQAVEHREREPDRCHRGADEGRRTRRVKQAEASFAEWA
jgi:hypothetical protein